ncbi:MAG: PDR/VanB family oxidoreductase [Thalassobaculales bacterium]
MTDDLLTLRIRSITYEAAGIISLDLRPVDGGSLPGFTAGAHIDLSLPGGLSRSYSLVNPEGERHRYVVAVNRDRASRGGSRAVHEVLKAGDLIRVTAPRNNFALAASAAHSVLIAGGIGITPLWCMVQTLVAQGRSWELHYAVRDRASAAFLEALQQWPERLHLHVDAEAGRVLDVGAIVARAPAGAHLYACGPGPLLDAFTAATAGLPAEQVHLERFSSDAAPATGGGFTVVLARSGREIAVPPGKTILEAVREAGINAPSSCEEGICGTCEVRVIAGIPDHRDMVLSKAEQAANTVMMICCSGAKSPTLTIDL